MMSIVNNLLSKRLGRRSKSSKVAALGKDSADGNLSTFSGMFRVSELSDGEKERLEEILLRFSEDEEDIAQDLKALSAVTSEVKAITNQAAMLHGERIKRAQEILKKYQEGAFTAWLLATYNNRQTPYNFLQYFEFNRQMPPALRPQVEKMPRQAVYALASREGSQEKKEELVRDYAGESKEEILGRIRDLFPLPEGDKRRVSTGDAIIAQLNRIHGQINRPSTQLNTAQKKAIEHILDAIHALIEES